MENTAQRSSKDIVIPSTILNIAQKIKNVSGFKKDIEGYLDKEVTKILEFIFAITINLDISDIHIEPEEEKAKLRVRLDGVLQDVVYFDKNVFEKILSRIKLISEMKLNVSDRPQDGRFSISIENSEVEIRSSALPSEYGESLVLRILNPKSLIEIKELGLRKDLLEALKKEIKKPTGMIIVTGPTGAGKTTTLYTILKEIKKPEIKIITIEDPIEYHLEGISQTQVDSKKGFDFANGLKSLMRQDPNVILVGEIRDLETANTAIQAALTGHLVLTTLHANDAAGTIARLTNLGAKPSNIGPSINIAIAQRLVRRVCKKCSKLEKADPDTLKKIKEVFKVPLKNIKAPKIASDLKIPKAGKCEKCNFTGYQGRIGIFEIFAVDDEIEKFILKNPSIADLKEKAIKKGMVTLYQDGLLKVISGVTTLEEVDRVVGD